MGTDVLYAGEDLLLHGLAGTFFDLFFGKVAFGFGPALDAFK